MYKVKSGTLEEITAYPPGYFTNGGNSYKSKIIEWSVTRHLNTMEEVVNYQIESLKIDSRLVFRVEEVQDND